MASKGQVEVVSAVLLTGIMISLVAVAYFWGLPVIQKQKDRSRLATIQDFMKNLNDAVKEVANEGGRRKISTHIPGELQFVSGEQDNITLSFQSGGSMIATKETIYLVGDDRMEVPVSGEPGIITARSDPTDGKYRIQMKLYYRNLSSGDKTYRIDLQNLGRSSVGNRDVTITIEKSETLTLGDGKFYKNKVNIRFQ